MDIGSNRLKWLTNYGAPLVILACGFGAYRVLIAPAPPRQIPTQEQVPSVETLQVQPHTAGLELEVDGVVVPYREISLSAEVAGRIVKKAESCRAGQYVTAGTTLFQIDPTDYEIEVQRLKDQLAQAEAAIAEADVELKNTSLLVELAREEHELQRNELARVQRLAPRAMSESEVDKAKRGEWSSRNTQLSLNNQMELTKSRRTALQKAKALAATQLRKAEIDFKRTLIVSPVSGVVVNDPVEQDSFVQKGTLLAIVEDTSKVEVKCSLRMDDLMWLWWPSQPSEFAQHTGGESRGGSAGTNANAAPAELVPATAENATVNLAVHPAAAILKSYELPRTPVTVQFRPEGNTAKFLWEGTLSRYDGHGLDERTRTVPCRVVVDQPRQVRVESSSAAAAPRSLMRGMFVSIQIHAEPRTKFVSIPETAIQPGKKILRVRDGKLEIVGPLTLAKLVEPALGKPGTPAGMKSWIVHAGEHEVNVGDHVVISPLPAAYQGMPVKERSSP